MACARNLTTPPRYVFLHGLDAAKDTWSTVLERLAATQTSAIALDLRGMGESELGDESAFSSAQLAADVHATLRAQNVQLPFTLVGHSMGGRVAMEYAARFPDDIARLIIEDMDIAPRFAPKVTKDRLQACRAFSRDFANVDECMATLMMFGYRQGRIADWLEHKRIIVRDNGRAWSGINPIATMLASHRVLATKEGERACETIAHGRYPVSVWRAGQSNSVDDTSLACMRSLIPRLDVRDFPFAGHSIHNTATDEFLQELCREP